MRRHLLKEIHFVEEIYLHIVWFCSALFWAFTPRKSPILLSVHEQANFPIKKLFQCFKNARCWKKICLVYPHSSGQVWTPVQHSLQQRTAHITGKTVAPDSQLLQIGSWMVYVTFQDLSYSISHFYSILVCIFMCMISSRLDTWSLRNYLRCFQ